MEILRLVPLFGFIFFVIQIFFNSKRLRKKSIPLKKPSGKKKSVASTVFLMVFAFIYTNELLIQSNWSDYSLLPQILKQTWHHSVVVIIIGVFVIILSNIVLLFTLRSFATSFRFGLHENNRVKLISSGVFAYSRNPFFLSIILLSLGNALVLPTIFLAAIASLSILTIHFFILKEEQFMHKNYGEEYGDYYKKVRRYF